MRVKLINLETGKVIFTCQSLRSAIALQETMTEAGLRVVFHFPTPKLDAERAALLSEVRR